MMDRIGAHPACPTWKSDPDMPPIKKIVLWLLVIFLLYAIFVSPTEAADMIGNVWEWVEDCYEMPHSAAAPRDGSAQLARGCDRRGSRGGSWGTALERQRPAFRGRDPATRVSQVFGFRVARDP